MRIFRLAWSGLLLALFAILADRIIYILDLHKVIHNHAPGPCNFLSGIENGAEDIAVLPSGMAVISTGLKFSRKLTKPGVKSALKSFNFSAPQEVPKELKVSGFKGHLNPHGLALFVSGNDVYIYLVNHPKFNEHPPGDSVEKFQWKVDEGTLIWKRTFQDPTFLGINDLVVVAEDKFYVTNFNIAQSQFMRVLESLLGMVTPLQNVVYFDGKKGSVVLDSMAGPNGITLSLDKKYLYVAETYGRRVRSYRIDGPTSLTLFDEVYIGSAVDNLDVHHETGEVWIGSHPVGFEIMRVMFVGTGTSSSQVVRVSVEDGHFTRTREIFLDNGSHLTASSVAVHSKGMVLIGSVNHKALLCKCLSC